MLIVKKVQQIVIAPLLLVPLFFSLTPIAQAAPVSIATPATSTKTGATGVAATVTPEKTTTPATATTTPAATPAPVATAASASVAQVVWVTGVVKAIGTTGTRTLTRRAPIYVKDVIDTGSGTGQISFTDNSIVSLRAQSRFKVDDYKFSPEGPASENKSITTLAKGGFRTITGLIAKKNPAGYTANTPVATIGVRGTQFSVFCGGGPCSFKLERGVIDICNQAQCLKIDIKTPYVNVASLTSAPTVVAKQQAVFKSDPPLTSTPPSTTGTTNNPTGGAGTSRPSGHSTGGVVSSFCIS